MKDKYPLLLMKSTRTPWSLKPAQVLSAHADQICEFTSTPVLVRQWPYGVPPGGSACSASATSASHELHLSLSGPSVSAHQSLGRGKHKADSNLLSLCWFISVVRCFISRAHVCRIHHTSIGMALRSPALTGFIDQAHRFRRDFTVCIFKLS